MCPDQKRREYLLAKTSEPSRIAANILCGKSGVIDGSRRLLDLRGFTGDAIVGGKPVNHTYITSAPAQPLVSGGVIAKPRLALTLLSGG